MNSMMLLATALWDHYEALSNNGFKAIDVDGDVFRSRPSKSRMRRIKTSDYGTAMSLLHRYKVGSEELKKL